MPVLGHTHSEKVFHDFQKEPPELQVEPFASCPVPYSSAHQDTHKNSFSLSIKPMEGAFIWPETSVMDISTSMLVSILHS